MMGFIRKYFISGLLVWVPIWVTILVIKFIVDLLGNALLWVPKKYQPDTWIGIHIPGINVVITVLIIFTTGLIVANFVGKHVMTFWDAIINRIPLVNTIYSSVKQVLQTVFTPGGQSFRKVFLVEYPREGVWTIAFQTGDVVVELKKSFTETDMISVYVPTTPNPTSGFLLIVPRHKTIELAMPVEQALKYVISLGVVQPNSLKR